MWQSIVQFFLTEEPSGPNTPFGPGVFVFDVMRVIVISCVIGITVILPIAVRRSTVLGQKARIIGAGIVFIGVCGTEIEHFGDYVHWRLYFFFFASVAMTWGYWSLFRYEDPAELHVERE